MEQLIDQIYWPSVVNTYLMGTSFRRQANLEVDFRNSLIAFGQRIMSWHSRTFYQGDKAVPSLPLLVKDERYQLVIKLKAVPANSLIYRLNFYNLQEEIFKTINFSSQKREFIFPPAAVAYDFEIINAGCEQIHFQRLQITPMPKKKNNAAFFADLYLDQIRGQSSDPKLNLLFIADSKRSRCLLANLGSIFSFLPSLIVVYVNWQSRNHLTGPLSSWLKAHQDQKIRLFSSQQLFDSQLNFLQKGKQQVQFISSSALDFAPLYEKNTAFWLKEDCRQPDWRLIAKKMKQYLGSK